MTLSIKKPLKHFSAECSAAKKFEPKNSISAKGELLLYGVIGDWWDGLDAQTIVNQLNSLSGNEIIVRIQSPGGSVAEGLAMYNNLVQSPKKVKVYVDGIAASMGSVIALAGDEIHIPSNALMMLHKPSAEVGGNSNDLRDYADNLDKFEASIVQIYSDKTGKSFEEIQALLADGKDHYFRGQEAVDYGLATHLIESIRIAAKAQAFDFIPDAYASLLFSKTVAAVTPSTEEVSMKIKIKAKSGGWHLVPAINSAITSLYATADEVVAALTDKGIVDAAAIINGDVECSVEQLDSIAVAIGIKEAQQATAVSVDAVANERVRVKALREVAAQASVDTEVLNSWIDNGVAVVDARAKALTLVSARDKSFAPASSQIRGQNGRSRTQLHSAMANALLNRAMPEKYKLDDASAEFRNMSMLDLIRASMGYAGENVVGKSSSELAAMAMHTTSDFPLILRESANKVLRASYELMPRTFVQIATRTSASDFRLKYSLQIGGGSGLDLVNEKGEFKSGTVSESGESYKLQTFGKIFNFTRQLIINDDLGALIRFVSELGNLASRKESDVVWSLVKSNPTLTDGIAVYSSNAKRKNTVAGSAINDTTLTGLKKAHRQMVGLDGEPLNITPSFLVVNSEREVEAQKMLEIIQPTQASNVNVFARSMQLIVESRLDGVANNPYYTFADPAAVPVLEYCYLDGQDGPTIETDWGFNVDGMSIKVRHDFGAGFVDFRGTAQGTGA